MASKKNNWVLVTGASSGIGAALAERFAQAGSNLVLVARREDRLKELCARLETKGVKALYLCADITAKDAASRIQTFLKENEIAIDLLINNAGFGSHGDFLEADLDRELNMIDLNCRALVSLSHQFGKQMKSRGHGGILNVASVGGFVPVPYFATYAATKAFVVSFSTALAEELRGSGLYVIALCPGVTESEFGDVANMKARKPSARITQSASQVAEEAFRAVENERKGVLVTGNHNRAMALLLKVIPRNIATRLSAQAVRPL